MGWGRLVLLAEELEKCQKLICKTVVMHYIVEKSLPSYINYENFKNGFIE